MYEGETYTELQQNMHNAIDAYFELCKERGIEPRKPFSGNFAVRADPLLHAQIAAEAKAQAVSMNQYIVNTLRQRHTG